MPTPRIQPIRFDVQLHEAGDAVSLPYLVTRALAWWIAAELIRRHPDDLQVIETHPGGGMYDCLSLYRPSMGDEGLVAHLNLVGSITHGSFFGAGAEAERPQVADARFNWLEVLAADERRAYVVEQLEGAQGLSSPKTSPPTTTRSIGPRVISRFAALAALSTRTWHIRNAVFDTSGVDTGQVDWSKEVTSVRYLPMDGDLLNNPRYRVWYILDHKHRPQAAVDTGRGLAWRRDKPGTDFDLMQLYAAHGSRVDRVMSKVLPPVE